MLPGSVALRLAYLLCYCVHVQSFAFPTYLTAISLPLWFTHFPRINFIDSNYRDKKRTAQPIWDEQLLLRMLWNLEQSFIIAMKTVDIFLPNPSLVDCLRFGFYCNQMDPQRSMYFVPSCFLYSTNVAKELLEWMARLRANGIISPLNIRVKGFFLSKHTSYGESRKFVEYQKWIYSRLFPHGDHGFPHNPFYREKNASQLTRNEETQVNGTRTFHETIMIGSLCDTLKFTVAADWDGNCVSRKIAHFCIRLCGL